MTASMLKLGWAFVFVLVAAWIVPPHADAVEISIVAHKGRPYVHLDGVAAALKAKADWSKESRQARLRVGRDVVLVTRDRAEVQVNGKPQALSAPAVVAGGEWLVPSDFLAKVVRRVAPGAHLVLTDTAPSPPPVRAAAIRPVRATVVSAETQPAPSGAGRARFLELRVRSYPSFTRVVVEADAAFGYHVERRGAEVRVRLSGFDLPAARSEDVNDGLIDELRLAPSGRDALVDATFAGEGGEVRAITLADPFRLVLDFSRPPEPERPAPIAQPLRHVVLDAGHGGHDSGALGPTGLQEKDVVLDVTQRVARLVEERLGIKVTLSRSADYFVPLRDRTSLANRERADLFVSIHANAHRESASEGVETYFLSLEATDNAARQVAERENEVVELESTAARARMDVLRTILWDLAQSAYLEESSNLAEVIQDSMTDSLRIPNRGVKQAGFYVLGGAAMPAVLIEIGFVTNPREERRLRESRYRDEISRAIFAGISAYKKRYDQRMRASARAEGERR
jgi:N-acetylmuramoyl-L-alanine amidase